MSNENKLVAIGVGTTIGRCLMGVGCGLSQNTLLRALAFPRKLVSGQRRFVRPGRSVTPSTATGIRSGSSLPK